MDSTTAAPAIGAEALERAIQSAGGVTRLAAAIGVSYQLVQGWRARGRRFGTPAQYVLRVEAATKVPRHELRPDVFTPSVSSE